MSDIPATGRQLLTEVTSEGKLKLTIAQAPVQAPDGSKVLVRVEASPINPSDLGLLLGCLLYTSPSPRDGFTSRMPSSA